MSVLAYFRGVHTVLFFFSPALTINKVCWKEHGCSVLYGMSLDHSGAGVDPQASEESHMSAEARDKEDTESITTPISPSKVSHPNTYHITDLLCPHWHHLHFRFRVEPLDWVMATYSYTCAPVAKLVFKYTNLISSSFYEYHKFVSVKTDYSQGFQCVYTVYYITCPGKLI